MRRILSGLGAIVGVGVPAGSFFSSYAPPLFPGVTFIVSALSIWIYAMSKRKGSTRSRIIVAVALIALYILLLQFTSLPIPPEKEKRVQIGFDTLNWSLTEAAQKEKAEHPTWTAEDLAFSEAAFDPQRVYIVWRTWSVYLAGSCLIVLYFVGFALWTTGFARLGIGGPEAGGASPHST